MQLSGLISILSSDRWGHNTFHSIHENLIALNIGLQKVQSWWYWNPVVKTIFRSWSTKQPQNGSWNMKSLHFFYSTIPKPSIERWYHHTGSSNLAAEQSSSWLLRLTEAIHLTTVSAYSSTMLDLIWNSSTSITAILCQQANPENGYPLTSCPASRFQAIGPARLYTSTTLLNDLELPELMIVEDCRSKPPICHYSRLGWLRHQHMHQLVQSELWHLLFDSEAGWWPPHLVWRWKNVSYCWEWCR